MVTRRKSAEHYVPRQEEREQLEAHGLVRIPLDVPFLVAPVNVVLVLGPKPALLDAGIRHKENMQRLEEALVRVGLRVEDLKEVWLTHPHIDHFGLAGDIVARSGATLVSWESSRHRFEQYESLWDEDRASYLEMLRCSGVQQEQLEEARDLRSRFAQRASTLRVARTFVCGQETLIAGRHRVIPVHVPGHSPWCTAFWFVDLKILVGGDALLEKVTSNPLYYPPHASPPDWQGIGVYQRSLEKLAQLPATCVIPGHGPSFGEHEAVVQRALRMQTRRQGRVWEALAQGPQTSYGVACTLFGQELTNKSLFLVWSEVYRHLEWLVERGEVQREQGSLWHYKQSRPREGE